MKIIINVILYNSNIINIMQYSFKYGFVRYKE